MHLHKATYTRMLLGDQKKNGQIDSVISIGRKSSIQTLHTDLKIGELELPDMDKSQKRNVG